MTVHRDIQPQRNKGGELFTPGLIGWRLKGCCFFRGDEALSVAAVLGWCVCVMMNRQVVVNGLMGVQLATFVGQVVSKIMEDCSPMNNTIIPA